MVILVKTGIIFPNYALYIGSSFINYFKSGKAKLYVAADSLDYVKKTFWIYLKEYSRLMTCKMPV